MLTVNNISKKYKDFVLDDISFSVNNEDYFVILGQSGAGKTILLEIIAGLIKQDKGKILFNNKDISFEKIQKRNFGLVFQDFAIFPHLSVKENILYALKSKKLDKISTKEKIQELAKVVNISHLLHRNTTTLSGGELQRVALARTLALEPDILLLDEPLSSLDIILKDELRALLRKLNKNGQTIIHVTHDYIEAVTLANKVAVLHNGKLLQIGTPKDVFQNPESKFVANFIGIKNFFKTKITNKNKAVINNNIEISLVSDNTETEGCLLIRSEDILISDKQLEASAMNNFYGEIIDVYPIESNYELIIDIGVKLSAFITETSINKFKLQAGKKVWICFKASAVKFIKT